MQVLCSADSIFLDAFTVSSACAILRHCLGPSHQVFFFLLLLLIVLVNVLVNSERFNRNLFSSVLKLLEKTFYFSELFGQG